MRTTRYGLTITCDTCRACATTYEASQHDCQRFFDLLGWGLHDGRDECQYCREVREAMDAVKHMAEKKVLA